MNRRTLKTEKLLSSSPYPKNLLRLFLPENLFLFPEVILKDPPKIPFITSFKTTSRDYFYFSRLFFASRGYFLKIASKDSLGFSARGREGGLQRQKGGEGVGFIENPRRVGVCQERGEGGPSGWEGVCGELGGGGLSLFFRGRNSHSKTQFVSAVSGPFLENNLFPLKVV